MKKQKNKSRLNFKKAQIAKILNPQKIFGGGGTINGGECSDVRTDDTQPTE